jgi:hypothetical protein
MEPSVLHSLHVGDMLPDIVVTARDGREVPLRAVPGVTTVVICCRGECERYLESLTALEEEFRIWEARLVPVTCASDGVIVADRYGQVFYARSGFVPPRELVEWLKHLGTLCPE